MSASTAIAELQKTWAEVTGQTLHARATERLFFEFWNTGFTAEQLRCVLRHYLRLNKQYAGGAAFRINAQKILGDLETFASTLGEAEAYERNRRPQPTPRQQVEQLRERVVDADQASTLQPGAPKSFKDVLAVLAGEQKDTKGTKV